MGTTLHHDYEVRSDSVYFGDIQDLDICKEMLDLASHIIETKKASFDPEKFKDYYQEAVVDLIRSKRAGRPVEVTHLPRPGNTSLYTAIHGYAVPLSGRYTKLY